MGRLVDWLLGRQPVKGVESVREVPVSPAPTSSTSNARTPCRTCSRPFPLDGVDALGICPHCRKIEANWAARLARLRAEEGK